MHTDDYAICEIDALNRRRILRHTASALDAKENCERLRECFGTETLRYCVERYRRDEVGERFVEDMPW